MAAFVAVVGVAVAATFKRAAPPTEGVSDELRVEADGIAVMNGAPQWKSIRVGATRALEEHFSEPFPARFKVDEGSAVRIGSPLAGRVTRVFVELGQKVKTGDPLLAVASPDIAAMRAERQKAAVDLDVAKARSERIQAMVNARALPGSDELNSDHDLRQAELSLQLASARLMALHVGADAAGAFTVVAPRDGIVIEKDVLPAQQVTSDASLIGIADLDTVWVVAELFEADAAEIKPGTAARVTTPSAPGFQAQALVESVSAVASAERHTVSVRLRLPNSGQLMRPNAYAQVQFRAVATPGAVETAASALVSDGDKQYVYVRDSADHFRRREVVAGATRDGSVEIVQGLAVGEMVVERGAALLDNQIALTG